VIRNKGYKTHIGLVQNRRQKVFSRGALQFCGEALRLSICVQLHCINYPRPLKLSLVGSRPVIRGARSAAKSL